MKKSLITGMVSAALIMGMVLPVYADNTAGGSMDVSYKEPNVYVISIPSEVILKQGEETQSEIKGTKINIEPDKEVQVKVTYGIEEGKVSLRLEKGGELDKVTATVSLTSRGGGIDKSTVVARFKERNSNSEEGTGILYFAGLPKDMRAGTWTGKLTFEVSLADIVESKK